MFKKITIKNKNSIKKQANSIKLSFENEGVDSSESSFRFRVIQPFYNIILTINTLIHFITVNFASNNHLLNCEYMWMHPTRLFLMTIILIILTT